MHPTLMDTDTVVPLRVPTLRTAIAVLTSCVLWSSVTHADNAAELEYFETKIRPVLVEHCYSCHSAAAKAGNKLKGGLLLDTRQGILTGGDSGAAVSPASPQDSLLLGALTHEDFEMPPSGKLSLKVIDDFRVWIQRGAFDPRDGGESIARPTIDFVKSKDFWSFTQPTTAMPPANENSAWANNEIDRFIMARLEEAGLQPVKQASARHLLRRATFDLTGLPPTPDETDKFLADLQITTPDDAYETVIHRLLSSTHYGERWGRHWLDVARYAEDQAHTFGVRRRAHAHEYRDWVINALNQDMPYNEFIKHQLAGDLLLDEETEPRERFAGLGILGLGAIYYKNSDKAQAQADELDDRIDTVTRGMLGLTVSCARCHDHKFDPIPTQDYYSLAGVFHNTKMVDKPLAPQEVVNTFKAAESVVKQKEGEAKNYRNQRKSEIAEHQRDAIPQYMSAVWKYRQRKATDKQAKLETLADELGLRKDWIDRWNKFLAPNNKYLESVPSLKAWMTLPEADGKSEKLTAEVKAAANTFATQLNYCLDERDGKLHQDTATGTPTFTSKRVDRSRPLINIEVDLEGAKRLFLVITDAGDGISSDWGDWINPRLVSDAGEKSLLDLTWISATTDHSSVRKNLNSAGQPLSIAGKTYPIGIGSHALSVIEYELPHGMTKFLAKGGLDGSGDGSIEFRIYTQVPSDLSPKKESPELRARKELIKRVFSASGLFTLNDKDLAGRLNAAQTFELEALDNEITAAKAALPSPLPMAHIVQDSGTANLNVYVRGDPARQGEEAPRRFLRILAGSERANYNEGSGRLALANDIASRNNPLTARVIVNRVWQHHFGKGLVATPSNFGTQGEPPSHPQLLDTLAVQFMNHGWSLKWLHRRIMLSAAYQLSSNHNDKGNEIDPANRLLWRMNRRRLEVESWRDALLFVSGKLDKTTGGPTVNLDDANNNRRTVYGAVSRHDLNGLLRLFDFPDANVTSATRTETTVPQQQLFVLNSEFFINQSKALAARLQDHSEDDITAQVHHAYQLLFGRNADDTEISFARDFLSRANTKTAKLTRWEQYAQALLGSNEFLYID